MLHSSEDIQAEMSHEKKNVSNSFFLPWNSKVNDLLQNLREAKNGTLNFFCSSRKTNLQKDAIFPSDLDSQFLT